MEENAKNKDRLKEKKELMKANNCGIRGEVPCFFCFIFFFE